MTRAPDLLSIPTVARRLDISRDQVYKLIRSREIRTVDVGAEGSARLRVREDDLLAFIEKRTASTDAPSTGDALAAST